MAFALPTRALTPPGAAHLTDEEFAGAYPAMFSLLAAGRDASGQPRQGVTVTVFADTGTLKAVIRERAQGLALFLTLDASKDIWQQCEAYVVSHPDRWREDKAPKR